MSVASVFPRLEPKLPSVQKPIQYVGGELNSTVKDWDCAPDGPSVRWALMYPDAYEVGLPNQGVQILYEVLNERDWILAERTYSVWPDMERVMREGDIPQFTVDSHRPVRAFDVLGLSFSTELGYTNMLNALDLAGIPLHAVDRGDDDPIVLAGGHAAFNPEPVADFLDAAVLGDGEEVVLAISDVIREWKAEDRPGGRDELLRRLAVSGSVYVPKFYDVVVRRGRHDRGGRAEPAGHPLPGPQAHADGPRRVALPGQAAGAAGRDGARAVLRRDLPRLHPRLPVLPGRHDHPPGARAARSRPSANMVENGIRKSGFEEVGLLSLSSADHTEIGEVAKGLADRYEGSNVSPQPAEHPRRRLQHHPGQRVLPQRPSLRPHVRPRGRLGADAQGDQQDGHRGGPDPDRRRGVLPRLAAGEALLHVRPPDRDRRRRARRSPTWPRR